MLPRAIVGFLTIAALSLTLACSRDSTNSPTAPEAVGSLSVGDIAASASTADTSGVRMSGAAPAPNGGPAITVSGNQNVINGGTLSVTISGDAAFNRVYMFVGGRTLGIVREFGGGIDGHYEMQLPSARNSTTVVLTFPQEIPLDEFDLQFAVANVSGAVGPYAGLSTHVTQVGTGDVQVTLSWDTDSDVDLHVLAPGGDEVYYARRESPSGGKLDLDSNAGCTIDGVRNENITWPVGRAPRGSYTVRVDYWSSCGVGRTDYTVRVNNGGSVQVVTGFFTGSGDQGGPGSGRTVATFERTSGTSVITGIEAPSADSAWHATKKLFTSPASGR
jgi:uncharacterized protein YfaP (DUF2135 family)